MVAMLLMGPPLSAQNEGPSQGRAVITVLPAKGAEAAPNLSQQDLQLKVDGKAATVTNFMPLRGAQDRLEVVLMLDSGARTSMATQFEDIKKFINTLPPNAKVTVAYMENGAARLTGPLTTDHNSAAQHLQIPSGPPGQDASPYFCLSDLAKHWPSNDRGARREVVMISDGVDLYNPRYDPEDPYVQASISDSVRAGLVVYSLFWENKGRFDGSMYANNSGQNLLLEVTQATGGNSYWEGTGNPVSFQPFFKDLDRRLQNQYEVAFTAPVSSKSGVESMKLKVNGISGKVDAPQQVFMGRTGM
ncbi:MAG TPA: hypothetical protein VG225_03080 [Terracidiphilus sp.]|jgi:hypothetical protein|nr:hypothetical protein [Terracidiphilus sp.]